MRPDVAVRIDVADDADFIHQRVAHLFHLAFLRDHDVELALLVLHVCESGLGSREPGALGDEQRRTAAAHDDPRRDRAEQPRVLDLRDEGAKIRHRKRDAGAFRSLLFSGK